MAALRQSREAKKRRFVDEDYSYDADSDAVEEFRSLKAWRRHHLGWYFMIKYDEDGVRERKTIGKLEPGERKSFEELRIGSAVRAMYQNLGWYDATVENVTLPEKRMKELDQEDTEFSSAMEQKRLLEIASMSHTESPKRQCSCDEIIPKLQTLEKVSVKIWKALKMLMSQNDARTFKTERIPDGVSESFEVEKQVALEDTLHINDEEKAIHVKKERDVEKAFHVKQERDVKEQYVMVGDIKVLRSRYQLARESATPQRMAQRLLHEVYTKEELETCGLMPAKNGRQQKPLADERKYNSIMMLVEEAYPGKPWNSVEMKRSLNRVFLDSASRKRKATYQAKENTLSL